MTQQNFILDQTIDTERVAKRIARAGICSRREAERIIENGNVRVNGKVAQLGDKATLEDAIFVNNKPILRKEERSITLIMNKPKGVLCTNSDPQWTRCRSQLPCSQSYRSICTHWWYGQTDTSMGADEGHCFS